MDISFILSFGVVKNIGRGGGQNNSLNLLSAITLPWSYKINFSLLRNVDEIHLDSKIGVKMKMLRFRIMCLRR